MTAAAVIPVVGAVLLAAGILRYRAAQRAAQHRPGEWGR